MEKQMEPEPKLPSPKWRRAVAMGLLLIACMVSLRTLHSYGPSILSLSFSTHVPIAPGQALMPAPIFDGHNDFAIWTRAYYQNHIYQSNFTEQSTLFGQVDFPRLRQGRVGAQFWSVYVECPRKPYIKFNTTEDDYHEIVRDTLQQIDLMHRMMTRFDDFLVPASSSADVWHNFHTRPGVVSSLLGIEGLHQIGTSPAVLRMYHRLGVRYATLTHTCHNHFADSEEPHEPAHNGLSAAGEVLIHEMNRIGMIVDLSHTSFAVQRAAMLLSSAPVMYSHSNAFTLCPHTRNVPDDLLHMLKRNDGIIMITFYPRFTNCEQPNRATLADVAAHIKYVGNLIGYRHVGIGSDFDGMASAPAGLEDVSKYPILFEELSQRGVNAEDLNGIMGGNVLRVLAAVENVAQASTHMQPLEDDIKPFFH